jgi:hypothetical protein
VARRVLLAPDMRNLVLVVLVTACAARPPRSTFDATYTCGNGSIIRESGIVRNTAEPHASSRLSWQDDAGDHYVTWPLSPTDRQATEYIIPIDVKADAVERTYDASRGSSTADWRLLGKQVCTVQGGYNDALARFMHGESIDDVARDLSLDHDEARGMVQHALQALQHRYMRDR